MSTELKKILLVEDDKKFSELLQDYLSGHGYVIEVLDSGERAAERVQEFGPDLVILDLMLPGKNGFDICRDIRPSFKQKIIFLTASEDDMDQVVGLELGADDFVQKPVQPRVLLARIRMLLRRDSVQSEREDPGTRQNLSHGQLTLKKNTRETILSGARVVLTSSEFDLLWLLANTPDETLSRDYLFKELRGIEFDGLDRSIDTKIVALRKKLGDTGALARRIITVRGKGYLFASDAWS